MSGWAEPPPINNAVIDEIEKIKGIVAKYFPIYNVQLNFDTVSLFCNVDRETLENNFESLRVEMKGMAYVPVLAHEGGEYIIHVVRRPKMNFKSPWINLVFFIATIFTTILAGSVLWGSVYASGGMFELTNLSNGALYFALPLMLILGIHELGHYYAAKRHGIAASLPFFIPIPPIFFIPIGTMGAFISIREPIPSKKALLDIGAAGPIAGLMVAIPVTLIGLMLSSPLEAPSAAMIEGGTTMIGESLIFYGMRSFLPIPESIFLHPMAFAGWVGLFVTALNLLPAGQLDGGHIARAVLGNRARFVSYGAFALMIGLGLITEYTGWLFFAFLIMMLGMKHPPPLNDVTNLDNRRRAVGAFTVVILVLCFVPVPFAIEESVYSVDFDLVMIDGATANMTGLSDFSSNNQWVNLTQRFRLSNEGNVDANVSLNASSTDSSLCVVSIGNDTQPWAGTDGVWVNLSALEQSNLTIWMAIPPGAEGNVTLTISANYYYHDLALSSDDYGLEDELTIYLEIRTYP
ncbi:MAG: site-2 protease family protein [Thermoplasmata archaeon]|nr:site-2 protease family protein [Thermoplasmata archaeon]